MTFWKLFKSKDPTEKYVEEMVDLIRRIDDLEAQIHEGEPAPDDSELLDRNLNGMLRDVQSRVSVLTLRSSKRLERYSLILIAFTAILALLTLILILKS